MRVRCLARALPGVLTAARVHLACTRYPLREPRCMRSTARPPPLSLSPASVSCCKGSSVSRSTIGGDGSSDHRTAIASDSEAAAKAEAVLRSQRAARKEATGASPRANADASTTPVNNIESDASDGNHDGDTVPLDTVEDVERAFRCSVEARTVSNAQLRRYIAQLQPRDYALGLAAVAGAKAGGLRPTPLVYEVLLDLLIRGGQLHASMELYTRMTTTERMLPTPRTYAMLMELCLQREMSNACQRLFRDMQRRGIRPSARNYDLMLTSLAAETPPKWEQAIEIFDKLNRERRSAVNARTYNALMRVYMNMMPFDWRVVYNCYHDMRSREPRIPLEWESYLLLREALRRGHAGRVRRLLAYLDAWVQTTPLWSVGFLQGLLVYFAAMWLIKVIAGWLFMSYINASGSGGRGGTDGGESVLPMM